MMVSTDPDQNRQAITCQHIRWLFDVCARRQIPQRQLLNHVDLDAAALSPANATVTWESLALIYANLGSWIADDDIIAIASDAWKHLDFRYWMTQASLYAQPADQITSLLFDPTGILSGLPIDARVTRSNSEAVMVDVVFDALVPPPSALLSAIAGELASLPAMLGSHAADVNVVKADSLTRMEFWLPAAGRLSRFRRAIVLPRLAPFLAEHAQRLSKGLIDAERQLIESQQLKDEAQRRANNLASQLKTAQDELAREQMRGEAAEAEMRDMRRGFQTLLANISEAVIRTDAADCITDFNEATLDIFEFDDKSLLGTHIMQLMPDAERLATESSGPIDGQAKTRPLQLHVSVVPSQEDGRTWIVRDLTDMTEAERERAALQHQLVASQRVDSLGELTGGIAHDFNNLLVAINGYAELGLGRSDLDHVTRGQFEEIRRAGSRAADMTQKLLTFARRQEIELRPVDLNQLVRGVENMIRRLLPATISVRFLQSLHSPVVLADAGQLEQVIVNLCVNARDAMPDGGRLTISVGERSRLDAAGKPDEAAVITIEDTGTGIPSGVAEKIFEPFFTTKGPGEGTGLGLSVVYGIIKRIGGTIELDTEPGRGSRFDIQLPLMDPAHESVRESGGESRQGPFREPIREPEPNAYIEGGAASRTPSATILLVEDSDQVRKLCEQVLTHRGYRVITAADGQAGIDRFERHAGSIDLVIADLVMPKRSGRDVFDAVTGLDPAVRMLFSTGYSSQSDEARFIRDAGLDIIEKPYTPELLCSKVEALLASHTESLDAPMSRR